MTFQFENDLNNAYINLNSNDISLIINSSLILFSNLNFELLFDDFKEIHSKIISYIILLKEKLSNYTQKELENGFFLTLLCNKLVPRLYLSFIFSILLNESKYLIFIIDLIPSLNHFLRGFFFRFMITQFFPNNNLNYDKFIIKIFLEMIHFYSDLKIKFENSEFTICGIIGIVIMNSINSITDLTWILTQYIDTSIKICSQNLSISIIRSIIQALPIEKYTLYSELFKKYFFNI